MVWPFKSKASKEELENLEDAVREIKDEVDSHDQDLDQLIKLLNELREQVEENEENLEEVEDETKRLDKVIEEIKEEALEEEQIDLQPMEQEIFKVLMNADDPLGYKDIGERMEEPRTPDQVRPKLISLKEQVTIIEDKKGRSKVFSIPLKVKKDYIEKGELAEIESNI
jgi:chromosome segregation ATPase